MSTPENEDCAGGNEPGKISWVELITSDVEGAIAYYTGLFGWTTMPFGEEYIMFARDGVPFGGVIKCPAPDVPVHWKSYIVVTDIDASIAQSTSLGGKLCWGPETIPQVGRIAIIQDPQGAVLGLHQPE